MQDEGYRWLSDMTWEQNQRLYCEKHDYQYHVIDYQQGDLSPGFAKIRDLLELGKLNPDIDWFLWIDTDALITNFDVRIEDRVDDRFHFIIATYFNDINAGVMMVRNSPQGRDYLQFILDQYPQYAHRDWKEQQVIIDSFYRFKDIIKIVPQRELNAACYSDGAHQPIESTLDRIGTDGQWHSGDWIMHWPGQSREMRTKLAQKYIPLVQNNTTV
jgi:hypothetical protein